MMVFLTTCLLFGVALAIHIILWRMRHPRRPVWALLIVFATVFGAWLVWEVLRPLAPLEVLHVAAYYIPVSLAYIHAYSAIENDSPTLSLVRFIAEEPAAGRHRDEVRQFLARRPFVKTRLAVLLDTGLVREQDGKYFVTGKGGFGFLFILAYRKIYGDISRGG
jgi:hypothetical protein